MSHEHDVRDMDNRSEDSDANATTRRSSSNPRYDATNTLEDIESEDDNEIELELTVEYMTNGKDDMKEENYTTAEENFRAALELAEEYDLSKKLDYGPGDIALVLADCLMRQDREEEALELLRPIADGISKSQQNEPDISRKSRLSDTPRDQMTQYKACHILGMVFMKRLDYDTAEKRAQEAFRGRRKVCGAQDPNTLESVQLLIDIYTAKDDTQKARAHRRFLEPKTKSRASLSGETSVPVTARSSSTPEVTKPLATAATTSFVSATPGESDLLVPAALQSTKRPQASPQPASIAIPLIPSSEISSLNNNLPPIAENERFSVIQEVEPVQVETPLDEASSEIPDYMRRAVQSASAPSDLLPAPPEVPTRSDARASSTSSANQSASQAALASIFASSGPRSAKGIHEKSVEDSIIVAPQMETISHPSEQRHGILAPPSKTHSWALGNESSVPSTIAKEVFPQPTAPTAANARSTPFLRPDPLPANIGSSTATKKKGWSISFSRSKADADPSRSTMTPKSVPMAGSAATSFSPWRSTSIATMESVIEPKRQMSLAASFNSQSSGSLEKEFFYVDGKSPRASVASRSYSTSTHSPARSYQELAPRFSQIKSLRTDKKSASIDVAMKLFREYDPDKKVLIIRDTELKKNLKEGHKGLASTGHGYAPIHFFCERKIEASVEIELLIKQGVDVNAVACKAGMPGHDPFTPLQLAIERGHTEIVRLLVEADVAIAPPKPGKYVVNNGHKETITQPLLMACTQGHTEITYILLRVGAARSLKEFPARQWHGNSLLHEACYFADTTMVKMLLDYLKQIRSQYDFSSSGPDYESGVIGAPGQQDQFGATPIMYAIDLRDCSSEYMRATKIQRRKDCLRLLLEHEIHGDLHSQTYRENIAKVLSTKWTRGPGKGHSIFCYCDETGDEELTHLLDPFRYQVAPAMRCHADPQCTISTTTTTTIKQGSNSIRTGSINSTLTSTDPKTPSSTITSTRLPEFAELGSDSIVLSPTLLNVAGDGITHFELPDNNMMKDFPPPSFEMATGVEMGMKRYSSSHNTVTSNGLGNGYVGGLSELESESRSSQRS